MDAFGKAPLPRSAIARLADEWERVATTEADTVRRAIAASAAFHARRLAKEGR